MLINTRPLLLLLLGAALVLPSAALAIGPDGPYRFEASGVNQVLVLGDDADFSSFLGFSSLCGNIKRKPTGNYKKDCDVNWPGFGDQDGTIKGSYNREDGKTIVKEALKLKGEIDGLGNDFDFEITTKFKAVYLDGADTAKYTWSSKACVDGRCEKDKSSDLRPASAFTDILVASDWTLDLDLETTGENKIKGTGKVKTGSGETIKFKAKGEYVPGETSTIKLKNKEGARIKLKGVTVDGDDIMMATFKNNFLGNVSSFMATSVPIEP